jgi:hypothetical protein
MPAPKVPQRVTMLYQGVRPGVELLALLGEDRAVNVIKAPPELAGGGPPADVVIVEVPAEDRRAVCEQVRHHYRGPLIVLLHPADNSHDLPPDRSRTLLTRPFTLRELVAAVAASAPAPPASDPAGRLGLLPPHGAQDRRANPDGENGRSTVAQTVPRLGRSWRERRLVRVLAILVPAALAFIAAFGLTDQSDRCPPRCDELTGADHLTSSSGTTQAVGVGPETVDSGVGAAGLTTTDPSVVPTAVGESRTDTPTSGATRIATTTSWSGRVPSPTSPPDPTRPRPSASSTTDPTTTRPRPSTTTTSSTTTTTTTTDPSTSAPP